MRSRQTISDSKFGRYAVTGFTTISTSWASAISKCISRSSELPGTSPENMAEIFASSMPSSSAAAAWVNLWCRMKRGTFATSPASIKLSPDRFGHNLTTWPVGGSAGRSNVSTLNYAGTVVANAAIVPAGANGAINVFVNFPTDVLFDINGYFAT